MLDLDLEREEKPPRDAATIVVARDAPARDGHEAGGVEVFCVERHKKSRFLGGAIVFPGGKLDEHDRDPVWTTLTIGGGDDPIARALKITACRETLEEAAILHVEGGALTHEEVVALRGRVALGEEKLAAFLVSRGLRLDLGALHPFARWVTPIAEARRFDTRFYVAIAPPGQEGAHDNQETTSSFWATPNDVLARFERGEVQLAPPTHRTLEIFAKATRATDLVALASTLSLAPICPRLVPQDDAAGSTMALVLPGDPEHTVPDRIVPGTTRYVLRGDRFRAEDPPRR